MRPSALRSLVLSVVTLGSLSAMACSINPPTRWAQGGAQTAIARARWERPSDTVDLLPDGKVLVDGEHLWTLDAAGRVTDRDGDPVAVLDASGELEGNEGRSLGIVGIANAAPPGSDEAWLSLENNGRVVVYDSDGESSAGGAWVGCQGAVFRTCTLVSQLVRLRDEARRPRATVGIGFGMSFGRR